MRQFTFTYDLLGRMLTASDPDASYTYTYNADNRVDLETQSIAALVPEVTLDPEYNALGRRTEIAATLGTVADYANEYIYNNLNRLDSLRQSGATGGNSVAAKRVDFAYDDAGQWSTITRYANLAASQLVATGSYDYDLRGRLVGLSYSKGATLVDHDWSFDAANRMTGYTNSLDGTATYTSDSASQLTAADYSYQADEAYQYDDNGNRLVANGSTYTTGAANRLLSDGTYRYLYDAEGNRTARFIDADASQTITSGDSDITVYGWDYRNRLDTVSHYASQAAYAAGTPDKVVDQVYDYRNRWIGKLVDTDGDGDTDRTSVYVYDGDQIVLDFEHTGTGDATAAELAHRYLWGESVDQLLASETADNGGAEDVLWTLTDHLNTIRDLALYNSGTDTTSIANHRVFDAYGRITAETDATIDSLFAFTGRAFDDDTGLQNNLNRWYDPAVGRWMSEDPIGFEGGWNLSVYVDGAPLTATDPTGEVPVPWYWWLWPPHYKNPPSGWPPIIPDPNQSGDCCDGAADRAAQQLANEIEGKLIGQAAKLPPELGGKYALMLKLLRTAAKSGKSCAEIDGARKNCIPIVLDPGYVNSLLCCNAIMSMFPTNPLGRDICKSLAAGMFPP